MTLSTGSLLSVATAMHADRGCEKFVMSVVWKRSFATNNMSVGVKFYEALVHSLRLDGVPWGSLCLT